MAQVERMTLEMDVIAKVDGAIGGINKIKSTLQGIKMPPKLGADLEKSFSNLGGLFEKYKDQVKNGFNTKGDVSNFAKTAKQIDNEVDRLSKNLHKLTGEKLTLNIETDRLKAVQNELTTLISQKEKLMSDIKGSFGLGDYFDAFRKVSGGRNTKVFGAANILQTSLEQGNLTKALQDVKDLEAAYKRMKDTKQAAFQDKTGITGSAAISQLRSKIEEAIRSQTTYNQKIETTRQELENIPTQMMNDAGRLAEKAASGMDKLATETKQVTASSTEAARATQSMSQQLQDLQHTTQYFFSLRNMINLFRRGVQDAVQSVKELDAAMTDTAVVTDYNVSDLWGMLPEYTQIANELGATTQGAYETMTLYFQQGLDQQQAFEIGAETMKMARIAGLEYAEATDMMTAALRGFNMELNETSAQRINDVYSKLAAVTASDTEELGTAMQRTASIAHSAGMSFEGTTAFLAQAIETTREPAENLGTAMKTIIARFQEMKKNPLEIAEVDGEEVSYNKVDQALQSIGVSLKDTNGQFRELDQVFLDISQRWDGLTQTQQRYIATVAAGSRQQSRFIAMMSNYDRTVELMDAANNSAGASGEQFGKTMDSLEAKLNQLHNAWQAFTMGIANNTIIKGAVDGVTLFLTKINDLIDTLSFGKGPLKSFLSLFTAFTGLKVAGKLANSLIGGLGGLIDPQSGFFKGFFGGAMGNRAGANAAQARAISNPIVQAINNQTAALGGKITANGSAQPVNNNIPNFKDYTNALTSFRNLSRQAGKTSIQDVFGSLSGINGQQQSMILSSQQGTMRAINAGMKDLFKSKNLREESQKFGIQMADGITTGLNKGNIIGADLAKMIGSKDLYKIAESAGPEVAQAYTQAIQAELENNQTSIYDAAEKLWHQKARGGDADYTLEQAVKDAKAQHLEKWAENFDLSQYMTPTLTKGQQLQNTINSLGSGITTTGQAFTTFGMILNNLGLQGVGSAFLSLGSIISSVGMTVSSIGNAFPNLFKKIGEGQKLFSALKSSIADAGLGSFMKGLGGVAIAGIALTAVIKIHQAIEKRAKDNAEKVTKTYEDAISKSTEKISSLTSAKDTFAELSKGVDQYGNNISLTQDEYDEYLKTSREIADLAPELIRGYDAQGNAIIATGAAIDELIAKEEELQKTATETFITNSSMNDLMGGIRVSDAFKKYGAKISTSQYAINGNATDTGGAFNKQMASIRTALKTAGADFESISQQLFGKEINLFNPSQDDLRLIAEHYNDIINLVESQNSELTEKQKEGLQDAFSGLGEGWNDMLGELQPLSQAIGQYLSSEGLDTIGLGLGEEFTESFNKGLESLTMTAAMENWDASKIKEEARSYAEGFRAMTAEGSEYSNIMEKVTAEQEKYNEAIGDAGAIDNYKEAVEDYAVQLENLADKYADGTVAGELFANSLRETANHIRNYTTESILSLGDAINTLSDEFTAARGAQERFQEATKGGDYYTAAEGYKGILDTILDEKNTAGNGSLTFWAGADEILGKDFVDASSYSEVVNQLNKIKGCFEDGADGVLAFNNLLVENKDKLEGLGHVAEDGGWVFDLQNEDLAEYAKALNMSEEALAGLIDKARQWVPIDLGDPAKIRQALEASEYSMRGTSTKGEDLLYTSESEFRNEARQQGIRGDDYTQTKADAEAKGVRFLNVENLTAKNGEYANQVLDNIGLKGADKTLDNAVAALTKMGFSLEDQQAILTSKGIKLADGEASKEQIEKSYDEQAYALENPTVAGIANDTGVIASAATALLTSMGILTDQAKKDIDQTTSDEYTDNVIKGVNQDFTDSASRNAAVSALDSKIEEYDNTLRLLAQGGVTEGEYVDKLTAARQKLIDAKEEEQKAWDTKVSEAQTIIENKGKNTAEQQYLNANAVDIQNAFNNTNISDAVTQLREIEDAGKLSHGTMVQLATDFLKLNQESLANLSVDELDNLCTKLGLTGQEATQLLSTLGTPFVLTGRLEGDDLKAYINEYEGITAEDKTILLRTDISGQEKVELLLDKINNEFGDGTEKTKTIILEAEAKLANGDQEGAEKLLLDAGFDENKVQEITERLSITVDGSVANPGDVQEALTNELSNMDLEAEVKAKVSAKLEITNQSKVSDTSAKVNYTKGHQDKADNQDAKVNYKKGDQEPPEAKSAGVNYTWKSQDEPKDKVAYVTYKEKDARGRNYSIPAHHSLSFGSAAGGMNVPKPKKTHGSQITALVGEEGFEVGYIPSEARSVIFGANGPEMTSFPKDTIIYPHKQSKEILRKGKGQHITAGSYQGGLDSIKSGKSLLAAIGGGGGSGGGNNTGTKGSSGSTEKKIKETADKIEKLVGGVCVWWENIARKTEATQRKMDENQKFFEKYLKRADATLSKTGTAGKGNEYIQKINQYKGYNEEQLTRAKAELRLINNGTTRQQNAAAAMEKAKTTKSKKDDKKAKKQMQKANKAAYNNATPGTVKVSYKKGKKSKEELVNLADYIYYDSKSGSYQVSQSAINGIKNKEKRKAVADAANKEIDDKTRKKYAAEDAIQKAQEALEKMGEELYETFFAWEVELTKIWNITQKIADHQSKQERAEGYGGLLEAQIASGQTSILNKDGSLNLDFINSINDAYTKEVNERINTINLMQESVGTHIEDLQKLMSSADEEVTLTNVKALVANKEAYDQAQEVLAAATDAADEAANAAKEASNRIKADEKTINKSKSKTKRKAARKDLKDATNDLKEAQDSQFANEQIARQAKTTIGSIEGNGIRLLDDTELLAYKQEAKELEDQIKIISKANSYINGGQGVKMNSDGTLLINFDTDALEADKQAGQITAETAQKIQSYVQKLTDGSQDLQQVYKDLTSELTELHTTLADLKDAWAGYSEDLMSYLESQQEKRIDRLKELASNISDHIKRLLDQVKRSLDARRKQEDNVKTETDIAQKQQRLSMLQANTSGGNQAEIARLQKEIDEAQMNYQRTLEDQMLDSLQQSADQAAEQREQQIALQDAILSAVNNAAIVNKWMDDPNTYKEQIANAFFEATNYDDLPLAKQEALDKQFDQLITNIATNQAKQENLKTAIDATKGAVDLVKSSMDSVGKIVNKEETQKEVNTDVQTIAAQLGTKIEESKKQAEAATQAAQAATQAATQNSNQIAYTGAFNTAVSGGKINSSELNNVLKAGAGVQKSESQVLIELAKTDALTWKEIIKAAKDMGKTVPELIAYRDSGNWSNNAKNNFGKAVNEIYNLPKKDKKGNVIQKKLKTSFKTGGIADFTGPAWLDGTPTKPELVLNARDAQNFIALKDILSKAMNSTSTIKEPVTDTNVTYEININVDHINNDYDVDKIAKRVKENIVRDSSYRNVTQVRKFR